jgi:protein melted
MNFQLLEISTIITQPRYLEITNDQSVIEICVNRCTSCIRETGTAEQHCEGLVQLLETCLQFNHKPQSKRSEDPPHAKISADIISCIFLNYNKKVVMELGELSKLPMNE